MVLAHSGYYMLCGCNTPLLTDIGEIQMTITVEDGTKCMLAKYGPNKLFGDDIDERKKLDDGSAIQLFDSVWQNKLDRAVKMADPCDSDYAYERLTNR
jgi:hypothetical protein